LQSHPSTTASDAACNLADKVCHLYFEEKLLSKEVGQIVGIHRHSVINIIHRRGLKPRTAQESLKLRLGRGLPEFSESDLRHLYSDLKLSLAEIGRRKGRSAQWALDELKKLVPPVKIRTPAEGRWARMELLNPIEDADELSDPAYEARRGIAKCVYCKLEGCGIPVTNLTEHLRRRHPEIGTRKKYRKVCPGARVTPFSQEARQQGCDVKGLMAKFAEQYVTRAELRECRANPKWDPRDFAVCRICALKCQGHLGRHLKLHDVSLLDYRREWPEAPTCSRAWTEKNTDRQADIRDLAVTGKVVKNIRESTGEEADLQEAIALYLSQHPNASVEKLQKIFNKPSPATIRRAKGAAGLPKKPGRPKTL